MRKGQVFALLERAKNDLDKIEVEYNKALDEKEISASLRIDVKNFMENLRSTLDYMAHDIYEQKIGPYRSAQELSQIKDRDIAFPRGRTQTDFNSRIRACLPDLDTIDPNLFSILNSIQSHSSNDSWLCDFCQIVNEKKHNSLLPQIRSESQTMTAGTKNVSISIPINNPNFSVQQGENAGVYIDGVPVKLSKQGIEPLGPGLERKIITWVAFSFSNTNINALPFLKKAYLNIETLANEIYTML